MTYQTETNNKMKKSELNLHLLRNFALYHSGSNETLYDELIQSVHDYIEEDHVDGKPADREKELRVYIIDTESMDDDDKGFHSFNSNKCSDETFMDLAEEQGNVFTFPKFQEEFNSGEIYIDSDFTYIRFIEVEVNL